MLRAYFLLMSLISISSKADEPPQTVVITTVVESPLTSSISGVGTFTAYNDVVLKAETTGRIEIVHFKEGERVKPYQRLFTLHNEAQKAQVQKAEASLKRSKNILCRKKKLMEKNFITPQDLEQAETQVKADEAELALAKEALEQTYITAPFEGALSDRQASKGSYVIEGDTLVRIQDLRPMRLTLQIPQKNIPLIKIGEKVTAITDAYSDKIFEGKIEALEPSVNEETRSVTVYATFPNDEEILIPGLYGKAQIHSSAKTVTSLIVPEQALVIRQDGNYVYKKEGDKAILTKITLGMRAGDKAEVLSGLQKGDQIVLEGQDKIHDGSPITVIKTVPCP